MRDGKENTKFNITMLHHKCLTIQLCIIIFKKHLYINTRATYNMRHRILDPVSKGYSISKDQIWPFSVNEMGGTVCYLLRP